MEIETYFKMEGQVITIFIIAVAAAEVSIGLALIVAVYWRTGSVDPVVLENPSA